MFRIRATAFITLLMLSGCSGIALTWPELPGRATGTAPPATSAPADAADAAARPLPQDGVVAPPEGAIPSGAAESTSSASDGPASVVAGQIPLDQRPPLSPEDRAEVRRLLQSARYATTDGMLIAPRGKSALDYYDRALRIDPGNPDARYGIEGIADQWVARAHASAEQQDFKTARTLLAEAALIDPGHPAVRPALTEVGLLETARRSVFRLPPDALANRTATVLDTLREAGRVSRASGCRAIIRARNDAEGRWIYQEMSAAPGRDRIRAELRIAGSPSVESICFQGTE
ncbi:MAG: tetratricopeptide repeat protein [Gammaproteobacteria bacterium]